MKIVVVSDSHRRSDGLEKILLSNSDSDLFIHCGDLEGADVFAAQFLAVKGNNDFRSDLPPNRIITFDGVKFFITHGDQFHYGARIDELLTKGKEEKCDIVCFGHTHKPFMKKIDGIWLLNPGSLLYNRDASKIGYIVINTDNGKILDIERVIL